MQICVLTDDPSRTSKKPLGHRHMIVYPKPLAGLKLKCLVYCPPPPPEKIMQRHCALNVSPPHDPRQCHAKTCNDMHGLQKGSILFGWFGVFVLAFGSFNMRDDHPNVIRIAKRVQAHRNNTFSDLFLRWFGGVGFFCWFWSPLCPCCVSRWCCRLVSVNFGRAAGRT